MQYRTLLVPAPVLEPIELVDAGDDDYARLVFGRHYPLRHELAFSSFRGAHVQLCYDDLGLYRDDAVVNPRALGLWSALSGIPTREFDQPLVGTFLVLGLRPYDGETTDVPQALVEALLQAETVVPAQPTHQPCPAAPFGGSHHLVPRRLRAQGQEQVCQYCGKTEKELRT